MSLVHDFYESLALSQSYEDAPWWEPVYRSAFMDYASMECVRENGWAQAGGIDRLVVLQSGKVLSIDEKVRAKDWPDFALEVQSSDVSKTPGWAVKSLACDFIAYAFVPSQVCYLLPFQQLRLALQRNKREWWQLAKSQHNGFRLAKAPNRTYTTTSICVPRDVLLSAIADATRIEWGPASHGSPTP